MLVLRTLLFMAEQVCLPKDVLVIHNADTQGTVEGREKAGEHLVKCSFLAVKYGASHSREGDMLTVTNL